jgi:hypothetical protein
MLQIVPKAPYLPKIFRNNSQRENKEEVSVYRFLMEQIEAKLQDLQEKKIKILEIIIDKGINPTLTKQRSIIFIFDKLGWILNFKSLD